MEKIKLQQKELQLLRSKAVTKRAAAAEDDEDEVEEEWPAEDWESNWPAESWETFLCGRSRSRRHI